jgi:hypothetical protein
MALGRPAQGQTETMLTLLTGHHPHGEVTHVAFVISMTHHGQDRRAAFWELPKPPLPDRRKLLPTESHIMPAVAWARKPVEKPQRALPGAGGPWLGGC